MNNTELNFKVWMANELAGSTGVVFDPKQKPKEDWNWVGAPGKTGVTPKENPIGCKKRKK